MIREINRTGIVLESEPRSYLVSVDEGREVRFSGRGILKEGSRVRIVERVFEKRPSEFVLPADAEIFP